MKGIYNGKKIILVSEKVPAAIGPYSPAVKVGKLMFISGQLPVNPESGNFGSKGETFKKTNNTDFKKSICAF